MELKKLQEEIRSNSTRLAEMNEKLRSNPNDELLKQSESLVNIVKLEKEQLRSLQNDKKSGTKVADTRKEERHMDKMKVSDIERRAMASIIRKPALDLANDKDYKEYRANNVNMTEGNDAVGTYGNGGVTVPTEISQSIVQYLTEDSPVFKLATRLNVGAGDIDILRETTVAQAGFVGELQSLPETANKLEKVHMHATRVGAFMQLTQQLINDSVFSIVDYSVNYLTHGLAKALEKAMLVGAESDTDNGFEAVADHADAEHTRTFDEAKLQYEDLIDLYGSIKPQYLKDSIIVVSRPLFRAIMKLADRKNQTGNYLISKNLVQGEPGYRLFGVIPVYVSDVLNDGDTNLVFGNFGAGYNIIVKRGMNLTHVTNDSAQALQGGHLIVLDAYMAGAVVNPDCFLVGKKPSNGSNQAQPAK